MKTVSWLALAIAILALLISVGAINKATSIAKGQTKLANSIAKVFQEHDWSYRLEWRGQ